MEARQVLTSDSIDLVASATILVLDEKDQLVWHLEAVANGWRVRGVICAGLCA